jgi:3-dehydroquinate synthase
MKVIKAPGHFITIGNESLASLCVYLAKMRHSSYYILCDENTHQHCVAELVIACPVLSQAMIIEIESGENFKSVESCMQIWQTLLENGADRKTLLINLGGGIVSDIGGFCASVFKRGIPFVNVPTSMLAMADASVGGKTGVNFHHFKNLVGTFAQPSAVFIHPQFLRTLSPRETLNGMAEIYKVALVADRDLWAHLTKAREPNPNKIIMRSVNCKNKIVKKDPHDAGLRQILNFGHTIGHAIESHALEREVTLLHGEAVVIGMIVESHLALQLTFISEKTLLEIVGVLQSKFNPEEVHVSFGALLTYMRHDKKASQGEYVFSLIDGIGSCKFNIAVSEEQIKKAFAFYKALYE